MITSLTATIQTATTAQAGTDDRVWLDVGGAAFELRRSGVNLFEAGHADAFVLPLPTPGVPASDVWRVLLCKSPDHDPAGWSIGGVTLVDQAGKILYARAGIGARIDASSGRQWLADDFSGSKPPSTYILGDELLQALLGPKLHESIHGDIGPLKNVTATGVFSLACECDGIRIKQTVRGRLASTDVDVVVSATLVPFVVHATTTAPARTELSIRELHFDIRIPTWMHILSMGVTGLVEVALEKQLPGKLRSMLTEQLGGKLDELGFDLSHVDRLALRPGALELILERQPKPESFRPRPFPLRWP